MRSVGMLLGLSLCAVHTAHAAISQVVTSPTAGQISLSANEPISVAWGVSTGGGTITSTQGVFRTPDGATLGTVPQALTKKVGAGMAVLTETVRVPETVSVKAKIMGASDIVYERSFSDGSTPVTGTLPIHIAASVSAGFRISGVSFTFSDNTPLATVAKGTKLGASAQMNFSTNYSGIPSQSGSATPSDAPGAGVAPINIRVNGSWQVAGPNPDLKNPQFRTLGEVNQYITGTDPVTVKSPALPTDKAGMYLLRIDFITPAPDFEEPVVRYYVTDQ